MTMRSKMKRLFPAVLLAMALVSQPSFAEEMRHVAVMTRLMKVLGDLEQELQMAAAQGDRVNAENMLLDNFQEQIGEGGQVKTLSRSEWLEALGATNRPGQGFWIEPISTREFGDVAVLSFLLAGTQGPTRFVVDIWKNTGADGPWKLAARYSGDAMSQARVGRNIKPDGKK